MKVENFALALQPGFYTGVPDSQLKQLCNHLMHAYGISKEHIIAANEGNSVALAAGYHLATGKTPVVYLQNSGIGNIINPAASLLHPKAYGIPCIFVVGWRGEPGIKDEPQHAYQGEVTLKLLEDMDMRTFVIDQETTDQALGQALEAFRPLLAGGASVAFVVRKGAFTCDNKVTYANDCRMNREEIIRRLVAVTGEDVIISTTGKASRELFEIREANGQSHKYDFLTIGSMGHASSIALGIALQKPHTRVWCLDGDGAALMHMGAMAVIGANAPRNLIHLVVNNSAHETVGGMPTVSNKVDLPAVAHGCGYAYVCRADDYEQLGQAFSQAKDAGKLSFIEARAAIGSRDDLGRPTTTAMENKNAFMEYLKGID